MNLDLSSIKGSKTGYTEDAGMCISALFETSDREMILITLGAPYSYVSPYNLQDVVAVIEYLDANYDELVLFKKDDEVKTLAVVDSKEEEYVIKISKDIYEYAEVNYTNGDLNVVYDGLETLSYKNGYGEKIGEVKYYYKDKLLKSEPVYLYAELHFSLDKFVEKYPAQVSGTVLLTVLFLIVLTIKRKNRRKRQRRVRKIQVKR